MKTTTLTIFLLFASNLSDLQMTLDSCLAYAMDNNKSLLSQFQNQIVKAIDKKTAWGQLAPEIVFSSEFDYYWKIPIQAFPAEFVGGESGTFAAIPTGTPWMGNYGVQARTKLVDVKAWQDIKLSALQQQAAQNELLSVKKVLCRNISIAFYIVQQKKNNWDISHKRHKNYIEIHNLIKLQFDKGLIDKISLNQSAVLLKEQEENCSKAETELQNALLDLKFWMGYPLDSELLIAENSEGNESSKSSECTNSFNSSLPPTLFNAAMLPDYENQKAKVDIAHQQYKSAIAALYPTLNLRSSYGQSGFGEKISKTDWFTSGFIRLEVRVPLFSPTKAYSPKRQAALRNHAEYEFFAYQESQQKEFMQKIILLNDALKSLQIQRENVFLAEDNERLSRQKIERGIIDMIQLKQVQQDLNRSQELLNILQINTMRYYIEIKYMQSNE